MVFVTTAEQKAHGTRRPRSDGVANRERLLAAAAVAIMREGTGVPMSKIAADAGVGVGTLYRHFASREALLSALTHRSFRKVLDTAQHSADSDGTAVECIRRFLNDTIRHGPELVLPLHGGPVPVDQATLALRAEVHATLDAILRRGREDGTIRANVTALDIVIFGAMIVQPLPTVTHWDQIAKRQSEIFLDGLALVDGATLPVAKVPAVTSGHGAADTGNSSVRPE